LNIQGYLQERKALIDSSIGDYLPSEEEIPGTIHQAMRYSVFAGGKRLRPILVMASAEAVGGDGFKVLPAACALEMIHTYSLIHDDLPAMDDDDFRRGKPTNHKVFGEAIAILAGDALLTHAFGILSSCSGVFDPEKVNLVISEVARAAGTLGMVGGQVLDIQSEGREISSDDLHNIHIRKTAALFIAALRCGAILSNCNKRQLEILTAYGRHLGLAFQITDDILDVAGNAAALGKNVGSDMRKNKATFPQIYGLEHSKKMAQEESQRAVEIVEELGREAEPLQYIVRFLASRDR